MFVTAGALLAALSPIAATRTLVANLTPSVPKGIYWRRPGTSPTRGAIVIFRIPSKVQRLVDERRYLPDFVGFLSKVVVALPGDDVCTEGGHLRVRGSFVADIRTRDRMGRALSVYDFCGRLPDGQAWVSTDAAYSFDSRYFGPVPISSLTVEVPLWTYWR